MKAKAKSENLIHVRLEANEALESKRDILALEMALIKVAQAIKRYKLLRSKELELKTQLHVKIKNTKADMRKLKTLLPTFKIPKILEEKEKKKHPKTSSFPKNTNVKTKKTISTKTKKEKKPTDNLEAQLKDIQNKLNKL